LDEWKEQLGVFVVDSDQQQSSFDAIDSDQDGTISFVEYRDFRIAQDYNSGLSAGAIVGIVLALLALILIAGVVVVFILYKKRPETYEKLKFWKRFRK